MSYWVGSPSRFYVRSLRPWVTGLVLRPGSMSGVSVRELLGWFSVQVLCQESPSVSYWVGSPSRFYVRSLRPWVTGLVLRPGSMSGVSVRELLGWFSVQVLCQESPSVSYWVGSPSRFYVRSLRP